MATKRALCLLLALVMVFVLAACGKAQNDPKPSGGDQAGAQTQAPTQNPDGTKPAEPGGTPAAALLPGTLLQLGQTDAPVLRGLWLSGNHTGSTGYNTGKPAAEGIHCVFEMNEWVECYPDASLKEGLSFWVLKHREDPASYESAALSEEMEGWVLTQTLEDPEDPDWPWGSFYLQPDDWEPGYYDLLFALDGKPVAVTVLRFYAEGELANKSDAELAALTEGLTAK